MRDEEPQLEVSPKLRIDALIARGSFGKVFRGHQLVVARDVAVKVLRPELAPETESGRLFRDEIRAIGTIDHRNVVRIFDADESYDGRLYFVMELLDGPTLQQLVDRGPLPSERARALVAQLLDGLAAVHAAGHIHADVKPSNAVVVGAGEHERVVLIDFGLSRVRVADRPAEAVGGTRTYMAPEQLRCWEVDARSDVFSAALVFVALATGRHRTADELVPSLDGVDPSVRSAIARALAEAAEERPTAAELARALRGEVAEPGQRAPFHELSPLTELDGSRLLGRDADLGRLVRRIESGRVVVLTGPSGTGKTSLLRAGLVAALRVAKTPHLYLACETVMETRIARALVADATSLRDAVARRRGADTRLVIILDQVEVLLARDGDGVQVLRALIDEAHDTALAIVLGVREDFVARLLNTSPTLANGVPQIRLGPLARAGAEAALLAPLAERGLGMSAELTARLLDDLVRAGRQFEPARPGEPAIYPPHLQLAGAALFDALADGETVIESRHYERLGGFDAIVCGHLERTLGELVETDREVARGLLLALVTSAQTRAVRSELDLLELVGVRHGEIAVHRVLERLASQRLVTQLTGIDGVPSWSLVHDTLVPRIEAWITVHDLDRRRMAEVVRFHLRQSQPDAPATFSRRQLRELARFPGLIEELDGEWTRHAAVWTPRRLVQRSQQVQRYRRGLAIGAGLAVSAVTTLLIGSWLHERDLRAEESTLRDLDIGRFDLTITPFDLRVDPTTGVVVTVPVPASELSGLAWTLHDPDDLDRDAPGRLTASPRFQHGERAITERNVIERGVRARGGEAFFVATGRGRRGESCGPSVVSLKHVPGHQRYITPARIHVMVPTCDASRFDTLSIPAGPFVAGGLGSPASHFEASELPMRAIVDVATFAIDRTEITNAAFAVFDRLAEVHDVTAPDYPDALAVARGPSYPRAGLDWFDARAYCRFLGKDLPTSYQWQKALRGGLTIGGHPNPLPDRNFPWGSSTVASWTLAQIGTSDANGEGGGYGRANDPRRPAPVATHAQDRSPYGVLDLAGNLQEWTLDPEPGTEGKPVARRVRITRGGDWFDTSAESLVDYLAIQNVRLPTTRDMYTGARCALTTVE